MTELSHRREPLLDSDAPAQDAPAQDAPAQDAPVQVHVINHTHWDREWFLTHEYTTAWIPALIDSLEDLVEANPDYDFLYDGQTLAIEDLLSTRPEYRDRVRALVANGNLGIGPLYSQPDWRMASGELHMRNLAFGRADAAALGGDPDVAWMVDTFGHLSQTPQMLTLNGIRAVYVWRGMPVIEPVFRWQGADSTELIGVDLFGGYRNLYGVTKTADIALDRLTAEVTKLAPSYARLPIPMFDGYDLDTEPEDPARFYADLDLPAEFDLVASSPTAYVDALAEVAPTAPVVVGELLSGKYGSTFPGSLSSRTYLKVMHHNAETALFARAEAVAALVQAAGVGYVAPVDEIEDRARELLRNGVHDCLCGVSIDPVHERMERSYRSIVDWAADVEADAVAALAASLGAGVHAISTRAMPGRSIVRLDDRALIVQTDGIGVSAVSEAAQVNEVWQVIDGFEWTNDHYSVRLDDAELVIDGGGAICRLVLRSDQGDTYSSEPGQVLGEMAPVGPWIQVDGSEIDTVLRREYAFRDPEDTDRWVTATVDARFDDGPVVEFAIAVDSAGTGFRLDARFDTGVVGDTVFASMPFDVVERPHDETGLLGHDIDPEMAAILMGQREVDTVTEYPMHDFAAMSSGGRTRAVLASGVRSYRSEADGSIEVCLRRSTEWLALTGLRLRAGDAGPMMYVPGARCERTIAHRIGFAALSGDLDDSGLVAVAEMFHRPPVLVEVEGGRAGAARPAGATWSGDLAVTALVPSADPGRVNARVFNPYRSAVTLADGTVVEPKQIASLEVPVGPAEPGARFTAKILNPVSVRTGPSRSRPDAAELDSLRARIADLGSNLDEIVAEVETLDGVERHLALHRRYVVEREWLELQLSLELNERRLATDDLVCIPDDRDPIIADIGWRLNELRVARRIYDYVAQALG